MKLQQEQPSTNADKSERYRRTNRAHRRRRNADTETVLQHYGTECQCCGATEGISVYALDGRTKAEVVAPRPLRSGLFNQTLIQHGLPTGFGTLCTGCAQRRRGQWGCRGIPGHGLTEGGQE